MLLELYTLGLIYIFEDVNFNLKVINSVILYFSQQSQNDIQNHIDDVLVGRGISQS